MVFRIGRKHAAKLRLIALIAGGVLPMLFLLLARDTGLFTVMLALAIAFHTAGLFLSRWLFFAQAEHVVSLYYDGPE